MRVFHHSVRMLNLFSQGFRYLMDMLSRALSPEGYSRLQRLINHFKQGSSRAFHEDTHVSGIGLGRCGRGYLMAIEVRFAFIHTYNAKACFPPHTSAMTSHPRVCVCVCVCVFARPLLREAPFSLSSSSTHRVPLFTHLIATGLFVCAPWQR